MTSKATTSPHLLIPIIIIGIHPILLIIDPPVCDLSLPRLLQVCVESKPKTANTVEQVKVGKLSLIDLAGSERASATENRGLRMIEVRNVRTDVASLVSQ